MRNLLLICFILLGANLYSEELTPGVGLLYLENRDNAKAEEVFNQLIVSTDWYDCELCHLYLGISQYRMGKYKEARVSFIQASKNDRSKCLAIAYLFLVYSKDYDEKGIEHALSLSLDGGINKGTEERSFMYQCMAQAAKVVKNKELKDKILGDIK